MEDHEKGMKVLANVQIFEQYRRIVEEFKVGIENQNTAIENQTNAAALGAGFLKLGSTFVKKGAISSAVGVVNAYSWYDTDTAIASGLTESGFTSLTGNSLTNYLETKDQVEVDAFFYTQKLAVQTVFEKIMGKGTEAERKGSQDERVIGTFAKWAGRGPGSEDQSTLEGLNDAARSHGVQLKPQESRLLSAVGGFGELGEFGTRPGGAAMGFYLQMQLMGANVSQGDAGVLAGMGGVDPLTTMVNQYNPVTMMANSTMNVRIAAATMGKDEGYMWEAQILNAVKQPIVAIGTTMVIVGAEAAVAGGPMAPIGALVAALGAGVMMLGNSIQVNVTTGERITKATDQSLIATGISAVAAFLGGAEIVKGAAAVVSAGASSLAQSSVRYDDEGRSQGLSLASNHGDLRGERAALSATIAMATSATGQYAARNIDGFGALSGAQQALFNDMISTGFQTVSQYGAQQVWGAEHSTYAGMAHADLGRLGSLGYSIFESAYKDSIAREQYEQRQQAEAATMQYALDLAKQANNESQKQQAIQILQGLGYSRKEAEATIAFGSKATVVGSAAYIARELASQLGVKKDGQGLMYAEAEKLLNELKDANGNVSQADMEAVARQMAAKYGGNAEGAFDWSSVAGEVSKTIGEDLKLMAERAAEMKQPAVVPAANQSPRLSPIGRFLNYLSGPTELEASAGGTNSSGGLGGLFDVFMDIQKHVQFGALDALFQIAIEDIQSRDPIHFYNELMKQQGADEYVIISPSEELQKLHDDIFGYLLAPQNDVEKYAQYYGKAQGYVGSFFVGGKAALSKGAVGGEALMTEAGIVAAVNKNADLAVELARRALANGRINGGAQAFGSRAHMYFDRLNRRLASQLERVGSEFSLQSEVFFDRAGTQYLHRVAGTIGPDAVIYNEAGKIIRALDLKTGLTAIQKSRQAEFLRRMGIEVEEIFRHR